jgi:tripeptidyl-peptidase II
MQASFKLSSSLNMDVYKSFNNAVLASSKKASSFTLPAGFAKPIYIAPLPNEKVTKNSVPQSSWFEGQFILPKDELGRKVDVNNFQYILTEGPAVKKSNGGGSVKDVKSKNDEYKEGLRDYQCQMIAKFEGIDAENLYEEVLSTNPGYVGAHLALIQSIESSTNNDLKNQLPNAFSKQIRDGAIDIESLKEKLNRIVKLADLVIEGIDAEALLAHYGMKNDNRPDASKIKQQMDKQKQQLVDAFLKKAIVIGKLNIIQEFNVASETPTALKSVELSELDNIMIEMTKFVDVNDSKVRIKICFFVMKLKINRFINSCFEQYVMLLIWQSYNRQHYGRLLKYLQKLYDDKLNRDVLEEMLAVVELKEWDHIRLQLSRTIVSANPQSYRAF